MADENTPQDQTPTNEPAANPAPAPEPDQAPAADPPKDETPTEKTYTKAEVEQMIQARLANKSRKTQPKSDAPPARKETPAADPAPAKPGGVTKADLQAEIERLNLGRQFDRVAVQWPHLSDRQRSTMERDFMDEQPDHPAEWMGQYVKEMQWATKSDPQPTQRNASDTGGGNDKPKGESVKKEPNPAAIDNNAPAAQPGWQQATDPSQLTKDQIAQIIQEKGLRAGQRYIRQMGERWGRSVRVVPPE